MPQREGELLRITLRVHRKHLKNLNRYKRNKKISILRIVEGAGKYKISKKKRMEHLLVNINDFRKHKRDWLTTIKFYLISKLISAKEKRNVLSQAKNQAEAILKDNGLIVPFEVYLEDKKDKYFRTAAWYQPGSSEKGLVEIFIESHLIGKDIDRLVLDILHEYSHAIYEEVMLWGLGLDIVKIIELIRKYKPRNKYVPFYHHNVDEEKEDFCKFFANYLFNRKRLSLKTKLR